MAQKKKNTELTLASVKKQAKKAHEQESYELENGSTIKFYVTFPDLRIENMYEELQKHYIEMKRKNIDLSDKMNLYFINLMMIKYFTHFEKDMPDELLGVGTKAGLLDYLNHFADTGLMKTIMDDIFLPEQVKKVYGKMTDILGASKLLQEMESSVQKKYTDMKVRHKLEDKVVNK